MAEYKPDLNQIIIDDGSELVTLVNKRGDVIGSFYFVPTDTGFIDRFDALAQGFDTIVKPLTDIDIEADGTAGEDTDAAEALREAERRLYDALDTLFGDGFSAAAFSKVKPFSPVQGMFYVENVLNGVGAFITSRFGRETKKINARVVKFTKDFQKPSGKHAKGKNKK